MLRQKKILLFSGPYSFDTEHIRLFNLFLLTYDGKNNWLLWIS